MTVTPLTHGSALIARAACSSHSSLSLKVVTYEATNVGVEFRGASEAEL